MANYIDKYKNYIIIAEKFLEDEKYERAFESLRKAYFYASYIERINILFELANIYLIKDDYKRAKKIYKKIISMDKNQAGAYYGLATINNLLNGDINYSIINFKMAIKKDKDYDRAYYYLAHCYLEIDQDKKALMLFKKCIDLDPSDYVAYNDIAFIYGKNKNYSKSLIYAKKSLEIRSDYFRALYNLGVAYKGLGENQKALEAYKEASEYDSFENTYLNMSAIYIEEKDFYAALSILDEGIELNNNSINLHYNRACVYARLNDKYKSKKDISYANKLDNRVFTWARNDDDLKEIMEEIDTDDNNKNT